MEPAANQNPPANNPPPANQPPANEPPKGEKEVVPVTEFTAVKNDMHRFKDENATLKKQLQDIKDAEMKNNNQWKEYAQTKEKDAEDWKKKYDVLSSSVVNGNKISAVRQECLKLGLLDSAVDDLELMELKDVVVETTSTGRINVIGAKAAAERIKSLKPHWFGNGQAPNVNGKPPEVVHGKDGAITYADVVKAEEQAKKTGDYKEYQQVLLKFKQQQKR